MPSRRPASGDEVRALIAHAASVGARLIPYGGGTSVVGGVSVRPSADPVITVDLGRLVGRHEPRRAQRPRHGRAPGSAGPALATRLEPHGLTIGHEPQSWELATVGGWVAARGSGLRSLGSGRIEQLYAGGTLEAPAGTLDDAAVSRPRPPARTSASSSWAPRDAWASSPTWSCARARCRRSTARGLRAARLGRGPRGASRAIAQARLGRPSCACRRPPRAATLLAFARPAVADPGAARRTCASAGSPGTGRSCSSGRPGRRRTVKAARAEAASIVARPRRRPRSPPSPRPGIEPASARRTCATRCGPSATAPTRSRPPPTGRTYRRSLARARGRRRAARSRRVGERVHVFTHLSHLYPSGSSLYLTYLFRLARGSRRDPGALAGDQARGLRP